MVIIFKLSVFYYFITGDFRTKFIDSFSKGHDDTQFSFSKSKASK